MKPSFCICCFVLSVEKWYLYAVCIYKETTDPVSVVDKHTHTYTALFAHNLFQCDNSNDGGAI